MSISFFFFNDTATTEIYTLSLHDALPISCRLRRRATYSRPSSSLSGRRDVRSEEHTSELQSRQYLVCRLLLEKQNHRVAVPRLLRSSLLPLATRQPSPPLVTALLLTSVPP